MGMMNEDTKSIKSVDSKTSTSSSTVSVSKRTRPPIHHTTSAQMRPFMTDNPNIFQYEQQEQKKKKLQRTKSENVVKEVNVSPLRSTKSDSTNNYVEKRK